METSYDYGWDFYHSAELGANDSYTPGNNYTEAVTISVDTLGDITIDFRGNDTQSYARNWSSVNKSLPAWTTINQFTWNILKNVTSTNSILYNKQYSYNNPDGNDFEHLLFFAFPIPESETLTFNDLYSLVTNSSNAVLKETLDSTSTYTITQNDVMYSILDDGNMNNTKTINVNIPSNYYYGFLIDSTDAVATQLTVEISEIPEPESEPEPEPEPEPELDPDDDGA